MLLDWWIQAFNEGRRGEALAEVTDDDRYVDRSSVHVGTHSVRDGATTDVDPGGTSMWSWSAHRHRPLRPGRSGRETSG